MKIGNFTQAPNRIEQHNNRAKHARPRQYFDRITQPLDGYIDYNKAYLNQMDAARLLQRSELLAKEAQDKLCTKQAELLGKPFFWKMLNKKSVEHLTHEVRILENDMLTKTNNYYSSQASANTTTTRTEIAVEAAHKHYEENQGMYIKEALQDLALSGITTSFVEL